LDRHVKEGSGKERLSHWELCEGTWGEEFFSRESKRHVKKILETGIFLLEGLAVGERGAFLPLTLREG